MTGLKTAKYAQNAEIPDKIVMSGKDVDVPSVENSGMNNIIGKMIVKNALSAVQPEAVSMNGMVVDVLNAALSETSSTNGMVVNA